VSLGRKTVKNVAINCSTDVVEEVTIPSKMIKIGKNLYESELPLSGGKTIDIGV